MRKRISQTLPLLGTLCLLIVGSAVLFTLTPADAIIDAQAIGEPPADAETVETQDAEPVTDETIPEPTQYELLDVDDIDDDGPNVVSGIYTEANDTIELNKHYLNDVFVAGSSVSVTGTIEGDLFVAAQQLYIIGDVNGSVRAVGNQITINGHVGRNVMAYADQLTFGGSTHVMQDVLFGARSVETNGSIFGDVTGTAETVEQNGIIYGTVDIDQPTTDTKPASKPIVTPFKVLKLFISWIGWLALGLVVLLLCPKHSHTILETMRKQPGRSFGFGALVILLGPGALLILTVTLIGIPLAMVAGLVWIVLMMIAKVYFGTALGQLLLPKSKTVVWPFVLGFSLVYLLTKVIGWFGWVGVVLGCTIMLIGIMWAAGSIITQCRSK